MKAINAPGKNEPKLIIAKNDAKRKKTIEEAFKMDHEQENKTRTKVGKNVLILEFL